MGGGKWPPMKESKEWMYETVENSHNRDRPVAGIYNAVDQIQPGFSLLTCRPSSSNQSHPLRFRWTLAEWILFHNLSWTQETQQPFQHFAYQFLDCDARHGQVRLEVRSGAAGARNKNVGSLTKEGKWAWFISSFCIGHSCLKDYVFFNLPARHAGQRSWPHLRHFNPSSSASTAHSSSQAQHQGRFLCLIGFSTYPFPFFRSRRVFNRRSCISPCISHHAFSLVSSWSFLNSSSLFLLRILS